METDRSETEEGPGTSEAPAPLELLRASLTRAQAAGALDRDASVTLLGLVELAREQPRQAIGNASRQAARLLARRFPPTRRRERRAGLLKRTNQLAQGGGADVRLSQRAAAYLRVVAVLDLSSGARAALPDAIIAIRALGQLLAGELSTGAPPAGRPRAPDPRDHQSLVRFEHELLASLAAKPPEGLWRREGEVLQLIARLGHLDIAPALHMARQFVERLLGEAFPGAVGPRCQLGDLLAPLREERRLLSYADAIRVLGNVASHPWHPEHGHIGARDLELVVRLAAELVRWFSLREEGRRALAETLAGSPALVELGTDGASPRGEGPPPAPGAAPPADPSGEAGSDPTSPRGRALAALRAALDDDPRFRPHADLLLERGEQLGAGGMGVVYRVRDASLGRDAALKVIRGQPGTGAVKRFRREVEITARLDHPSIPPVYEAGSDGRGREFMLMRLIEGDPLAARIRALHREGGLLSEAELRGLLEVLLKVGEAVAYAHGQGVIHRDLKPDNVMVGRFGEVMVMDWGLARDVGRREEEEAWLRSSSARLIPEGAEGAEAGLTRGVLGTPGYLPPEQAEGGTVDARADVFALGAILSSMLTGRPPIEGASVAAMLRATREGWIVLPRARRPELPAELHDLAAAALARDPEARLPSAGAFVADLRAYLAGNELATHRYSPWERLLRGVRRRPTALVGSLAAILLAALASGAWLQLARVEAEGRVRAVQAHRAGETANRARLADAAQRVLAAARRELEEAPAEARNRRISSALRMLQQAQRWRDLSPGDLAAARALYQASRTLGAVALESEQWGLAREAYLQGCELGIDDDAAAAAVRGVDDAREAEARRRRQEVAGLLARAAAGELRREADGLREAVYAIVRYSEANTVEVLVEALEPLTDALRDVERELLLEGELPDPVERELGAEPLHGLAGAVATAPARRSDAERALVAAARRRVWSRVNRALGEGSARRSFREILASRQGAALGTRLDAAQLACRALGRIGIRTGAVGALVSYLRAEAGPTRAAVAALALCRLGGTAALDAVHAARRRFGLSGLFADRVQRGLRQQPVVLTLAEESPSAYFLRAERRTAHGDLRGAVADYDRAIELRPGDANAWHNRGHVKALLGDYRGAVADCQRTVELSPESGNAWHGLGFAKLGLGDHQGALADFERALEKNPRHAKAWSSRGTLRWKFGDVAGAIADLTKALEFDPRYVNGWTNRGAFRMQAGDARGAVLDFTRAVELDPRDAGSWRSLGTARTLAGDAKGAIADLDRALELDPNDAMALSCRGTARSLLRDRWGALADYGLALELDPGDAGTWYNRGDIKADLNDHRGAISDFNRAIELKPDHVHAWDQRGNAKAALGDLRGAIRDFDRALELDPQRAGCWADRGQAKAELGELAGAIADYRESVRLDPEEDWVHFSLGRAHALAGEPAPAIAALERAAELDPQDAYAPLWIAGLSGDLTRLTPFAGGKGWVAQLVRFYLGKLSEGDLLVRAEAGETEQERRERLCEAHGYVGLAAERAGDLARAAASYRACVATGVTEYVEHAWAKVRLAQWAEDR